MLTDWFRNAFVGVSPAAHMLFRLMPGGRSRGGAASAPAEKKATRVMAISSGGGHWVQLLRLRPAFEGCDVTFVTVREGYRSEVPGHEFRVVPDANRWDKIALIRSCLAIAWLMARERPDVVVTTGAAPGYFAVLFSRWIGARSIWIDSVANVEELSMSGQKAGRRADLWLTQWPHLARPEGPFFLGSVL